MACRRSLLISPSEHYLSAAEHDAEITKISEELMDAYMQFPRTQNLEYAVLKGNLIIEHVVTQFIRCHSRVSVDLSDIRFSSAQKLEVAYLMGFGANNPTLLPTVQLFNKARNQVAHGSVDRRVVDELIRINSEVDAPPLQTDRHRISALRALCTSICAMTAGQLTAEHHFTTLPA